MKWNKVDVEGYPPVGSVVLVVVPNSSSDKVQIDAWEELWECPVDFSTCGVCTGVGWESGRDYNDISHWAFLPSLPKELK